jgi:uncharacterized membrane protein YfcA
MSDLWFLPIGAALGAFGTLIGAGGGFLLVPLLVLLFPQDTPAMITGASLAVVFFNAASGTAAYARMRRISYRTGVLFAAATIPGALLGSYLTRFLGRKEFDLLFGILLLALAVFTAVRRSGRKGGSSTVSAAPLRRRIVDTVVDREGGTHSLSFNVPLGMALSLLIGVFSSFVGIGGGIIHVPLLASVFGFPMHVATATSHFILVFTSLAGVAIHVLDGTWPAHLGRDLCLAAGVAVGAQVGALFSSRLKASAISIAIAGALSLVGLRLILGAL